MGIRFRGCPSADFRFTTVRFSPSRARRSPRRAGPRCAGGCAQVVCGPGSTGRAGARQRRPAGPAADRESVGKAWERGTWRAPDVFDMLDRFESYRTSIPLSSLLFASRLKSFHGCRTEQARTGARSLPPDGGRDRDRGRRGRRGADEHLRRRRRLRPRHVRPRGGVAAGAARVGAGRPPRGRPGDAARRHEGGCTPARHRLRDAEAADVRSIHGAARGDRPSRAEAAPLRALRHLHDPRRA